MSKEAKELGFSIGTPIFKVKHLIKKHNIQIFSSNYELYGDLSMRVMDTLSQFTPELEVYSIDEAFLSLRNMKTWDLDEYGREIKKTVEQWTGIPVCVGIANTKTLSKVANRIAKKNKLLGGVLDFSSMPEDEIDSYLNKMNVEDVWGIYISQIGFPHNTI